MWPGPPGVGRQTVSNVLNGRGRVGEATKARVLDAVTTLGYHPHHGARSLRSRRTRQLAYIMPPMQLLPGNYIMQQFLQALAAASVRRSHNVVLVVRGLPRPEHGTAAPGQHVLDRLDDRRVVIDVDPVLRQSGADPAEAGERHPSLGQQDHARDRKSVV